METAGSEIIDRPAFLGWLDAYMATSHGTKQELQLKLACLYHSEIILPCDGATVDAISRDIASGSSINESVVRSAFLPLAEIVGLSETNRIVGLCCRPVDGQTWGETGGIKRGLRGPVYRTLAEESDISVSKLRRVLKSTDAYGWLKDLGATAIGATGAVKAWEAVNQSSPCDIISFGEATAYAANRSALSGVRVTRPNWVSDLEIVLPDIRQLRWHHVFELREDRNLISFREWMRRKKSGNEPADLIEGLWSAFGQVLPNPRRVAIKGVITNIPSPVVINPIAVTSAVKDTLREQRRYKEQGLNIFLYRMRGMLYQSNDTA